MLLKTFFLIFLLSVATFVRSQPNQYAEFQRSISNTRSNAAYIEAIETAARTPNAKWQPTGVDRQAINQLTNALKKDEADRPGLRQWSASDMAAINAQAAINNRSAAVEKQRSEGRAAVTVPVYRDLLATGISSNDASRIIDLGINKDGTVSIQFPYLYFMTGHYKAFREQAQKATFTDLLSLLLQYEILPDAALTSIDILEKRFPEQQFIIDMTRLKVLPRFFSGISLEGNYTSAYASKASKTDLGHMSDLFFKISDKYPEISKSFLSLCDDHYNPYVSKIKLLWANKNTHKEALVLMLKYLYMPNDNFMAALASTGGKHYLLENDVAGFEKLAKLQKVPPLDIVFGQQIEGYDYITWRQYWQSGKYVDGMLYMKRERKLLIKFAEAGYPDAQNIYGIRIGLGFENLPRKDALLWLQKAAASGHKMALKNLSEICQREIKGIEDFCKTQK